MILKEKVIVITGASRGLGRELARVLSSEGAQVIISGINRADLNSLAEELGVTAIIADVTKEKEMQELVNIVVEKYGAIDIWINNAGVWSPHGPIEELKLKEVRRMLEVNVVGLIMGSQLALRQMRKQQSGVIMNILSTSALEGRHHSSGYCASKYGADGFTKSLQLEVQGSGIIVIAAYPGGMKTNLFDAEKPDDYDGYMDTPDVANDIIKNLKLDDPEKTLIIRRAR